MIVKNGFIAMALQERVCVKCGQAVHFGELISKDGLCEACFYMSSDAQETKSDGEPIREA
jgi:NMD protein affecting ribosome stability and mRNA decay